MNEDLKRKRENLLVDVINFTCGTLMFKKPFTEIIRIAFNMTFENAESLIRQDERARIFSLLRNKEYTGSYTQQRLYAEAADFLETELKRIDAGEKWKERKLSTNYEVDTSPFTPENSLIIRSGPNAELREK